MPAESVSHYRLGASASRAADVSPTDKAIDWLPRAYLREVQDRAFRRLARELANNDFCRGKLCTAGKPSAEANASSTSTPFESRRTANGLAFR